DGKRVLFTFQGIKGSGLYVADATLTHVRLVLADVEGAQFSRDGSAFAYQVLGPTDIFEFNTLYILNIATGKVKDYRISTYAHIWVSPTFTKIAHIGKGLSGSFDNLYVSNLDGSGLKVLASGLDWKTRFVWSPDEIWIAYSAKGSL